MTTTTTRRAILAGAATLPALSLPARAAEIDPTFAAIERHRRWESEIDRLLDQINEVEWSEGGEDLRPIALIEWRHYSAICGSEIDRFREELLQDPFSVLTPGAAKNARNRRRCVLKIEREYQQAKARERAIEDAAVEWDKTHGTHEWRLRLAECQIERDAAQDALSKITPTTIAGAAALVDHSRTDLEVAVDWQPKALVNAVTALKQLAAVV